MDRHGKVLLVDDDWDLRATTSLRLSAVGYDTVTACDGDEAVASAVEHHPDVIVLDVGTPKTDGLQALGQLRGQDATKNTPIVMLSASLRDQQAALDAGALFFLSKPYEGRTLVAAVDSAMTETAEPTKKTATDSREEA